MSETLFIDDRPQAPPAELVDRSDLERWGGNRDARWPPGSSKSTNSRPGACWPTWAMKSIG